MEQSYLRRFTIDKFVSLYEIIGNYFFAYNRKKRLNNTDFSIISNNCWGGSVYRRYGLPYLSPTVGMYFFAEEYIKLLSNLYVNINKPFKIITASESRYADELKKKGQENVLVGVIGDDIEVVLLHYKNKEEALDKWNRRVARINFDNLIVKMSEMNMCTHEHLKKFDNMKFRKKILFTTKKYDDIKNGIIIKRYTKGKEISNDTLFYDKYIDLDKLINS